MLMAIPRATRSAGLDRSVPGGTPEARVDGGPQHPDRHSLGDNCRRGVDATICEGTRRATARPHSCRAHAHDGRAAATNAHHPYRFRDSLRSDRQRLRSEPPAAGRQRTGFVTLELSLAGKWLELLKEIAPRVNRVAFLFNPATATFAEYYLNPLKAAAASVAVEAIAAPVHDTSEFETVIAAQAREPNSGLIVMPDTFMVAHRAEIISLAARYRLPAIYPFRLFAEVGGLLSYGVDLTDNFRRSSDLRRSHPQGCEAERASRPDAGQVRAGDKSQDRQSARPRRAYIFAAARRRGDRISSLHDRFGPRKRGFFLLKRQGTRSQPHGNRPKL